MKYKRFKEILRNAIMAYEFELSNQDYETEVEEHEVLLNEFGMTEDEYKIIMKENVMTPQEFHRYVELECERQWNENQVEEYGEWYEQDDDTKAEYYNDMYRLLNSVMFE